jgi:hypothetical protein
MRNAGFRVEGNLVTSPAPARRLLGIPSDLLSCHAAMIEGCALEGHVLAEAVLRLLTERPAGVRGLAMPAMPTGSPGMGVPGAPGDDDGRRHRLRRRRGAPRLHAPPELAADLRGSVLPGSVGRRTQELRRPIG